MFFQLWDKGSSLKVASKPVSDEESSTETDNPSDSADSPTAVRPPDSSSPQYARVCVRLYRADGLPKPDKGIIAEVKKRCSVDACRLMDPYVQVFFAGLKGVSSKRRRTSSPSWDEQLVFCVPFPLPPSDPLVLQVRDDDLCAGGVVGTTLVHLHDISNPRDDGFLPVFGPCYVYLRDTRHPKYDSTDDVSYKGRLLMAIVTETASDPPLAKPFVKTESTPALVEGSYGFEDEFLVFCCIQEATMIDRRIGDNRQIRFTLQMGEVGRDGKEISEDSNYATPLVTPVPINREYLQAPYEGNMPCVWLKTRRPDNRKRMYASNVLHKMAQKLKDTIKQVQKPENEIFNQDEEKNKACLTNLENIAKTYLKVVKECFDSYAAKTLLDKERLKIYQSDIEDIVNVSVTARNAKNKTMLESSLDKLNRLKHKMKILANDPQCMLPDVVLWLECGGKRVGFAKIPARRLLFVVREHERGVHSATTTDFFLRAVGKSDDNNILARVKCYFWLGLTKNMSHCFEHLPEGFTKSYYNDSAEETDSEAVPRVLNYYDKYYLQLRAHIHQARSMPCLDLTRSPACIARVFIKDRAQSTQVMENTVNPIWDEMLYFRGVAFYGDARRAKEAPPTVVVEIVDTNAPWKTKLLGRAIISSIQVGEDFRNPPTLQWFEVQLSEGETNGQLLAAFELAQDDHEQIGDAEEDVTDEDSDVLPIPPEIRPRFSVHRIEILFWGLRDIRRYHWRHLNRPRIDVECAGEMVQSSPMVDYRRHPNFSSTVAYLDMDLPDDDTYLPSIVIKLMDTRSFGRQSVIATHVLHSLNKYAFQPRQSTSVSKERFSVMNLADFGDSRLVNARPSFVRSNHVLVDIGSDAIDSPSSTVLTQTTMTSPWKRDHRKSVIGEEDVGEEDDEDEELDWWSRYYISTNHKQSDNEGNRQTAGGSTLPSSLPSWRSVAGGGVVSPVPRHSLPRASMAGLRAFRDAAASVDMRRARVAREADGLLDALGFKVYPCELESVPEFSGFQEWLHTFELTRGKKFKKNAPPKKVVGIFKGCFRIYRTPLPHLAQDDLLPVSGGHEGLFGGLPSNTPTRVLVRAYIIKAMNLAVTDVTNTTDPYLVMKLGSQTLSDKDNYISKQLNPVFGKCFEFVATFPSEAILRVQVLDWDLLTSHDLVGETAIDLENRFYSRHRPGCGMARVYETSGPNAWRDPLKPTDILSRACREDRLDGPHVEEAQRTIRIGEDLYHFHEGMGDDAENMALCLLHRWGEVSPGKYALTPEHVETRTLYHPKKPGESQGQLEMWLDMFEENTAPPHPPRDISVRKPESFELRVVIWNTDEVLLSDVAIFTGEKMSDIYVKGWLTGEEDAQRTDVHYRSLTGEGNFNWRFVFPFDYLRAERKVLVSRKVSVFSWDETEFKLPARLELQVWDADHFKKDDCLGSLTLDLSRFPRGAKTAKHCTLDILRKDGSVPHVSIFRQTRVRGWWPFSARQQNGHTELTGKLEAEIELLTREEADKFPVGLARQEPEALHMPKRPETSFLNFLHPFKTLKYAFWRNYKGKIIKFLIIVAFAMLLVLFFYSVPGYTAKKMLGA